MRLPVRQRGLSLIELLVAIAILAVLSGALALASGTGSGARTLEREAQRFATLVTIACERAEISGRDHGIHLARDGYAFSLALADGWRLVREGELRDRALPEGVALALEGEHGDASPEGVPAEPQAACFASGELTPFVVSIGAGDLAPYTVEAQVDGTIEARAAALP